MSLDQQVQISPLFRWALLNQNRPGEPFTSRADIRKIKKELNWKPTINFKEGISIMIKEIYKWKDAPLWTPKKIKSSTKNWFKYLSKKN